MCIYLHGYSIILNRIVHFYFPLNVHFYSIIYNYFASGNYRENTTKETYSKAWKEYWQNKSEGYSTADAINEMRYNYGGVARKYPIPEWNGIYLEEINYIIDLVCESIEDELPE